jgi:puromycin-sensitive aminopeptidase
LSTNPYRLPRTVVPARYELVLRPDLDDATFTGDCVTEVEVLERTDEIVLNAIELDIDEAWLEGNAPERRRVNAELRLDPETERAHLLLAAPVEPGTWWVNTRFRGVLNDKLRGFYRSTFTDEEGVEHTIATTQMEATHARRAFPCWDEPDLKAVFAVTLVVPEGLFATSNGQELSRSPAGDGHEAVQFADTMPMSTYLVAFIVGELEATEPVDVDGVPVRVVHRPERGHLASYALDVAAFALRYFGEYYGIAYPGDKLDLVAIPDFAFGAMENMGCVTFREVLLLVDPTAVTQPELQNVVDVIAHELAHMWFGNLVTMRWWNGIWLNEAFATFMEMKCTDAFRPDWERWVAFGASRTAAFDVDALTTTRPIEFEVVSPEDAEGMFDVLTYEKGAAVVRMLERYLGEDVFREGIRTYLSTHQYGNTETTDLWDAIEQASGQPTRRIMDSWIFQGGFPEVSVEYRDDHITLRQQRFRYLEGDDGTRWAIPFLVAWGDDGARAAEKGLLDEAPLELAVTGADWIHVNHGASGFFRVQYDEQLVERLAARSAEVLLPAERYALVDDIWASVLAGHTSPSTFLDLTARFENEDDLAVWQRILGGLAALDRLVEGDARTALAQRVAALLRPLRERLGPDPRSTDDDRTRQLRATALESAALLGDEPAAVDRATELWEHYAASSSSVDPPLAAASIAVLAAKGGATAYETFLDRFRTATTPQDELRFLSALADTEQAELFDRTLALGRDEVRAQNAPYLLRRALGNRDHGATAWTFVRDNWEVLVERFPSNSIVRMLEGVRALSQPDAAETVFDFFETHPLSTGAQTLAQHLERLRVNVELRQRESAALTRLLTGA